MQKHHSLTSAEKERLKKGIQAAWATPFVDDIENFIWEAIFAYTKDVPVVDPLSNIRKKLLFDVVDPVNAIGWSAKSLQWSIAPQCQFELVIQRSDIFKKSKNLGFDDLHKDSPTVDLGNALLTHWHNKIQEDAEKQGVLDRRVCVLLKTKNRQRYAYYEDNIEEYIASEIRWQWTDNTKTGLQGIRIRDGFCVYRWYPNQKQFFERFSLPEYAYVFELSPKRLSLEVAISHLVEVLDKP